MNSIDPTMLPKLRALPLAFVLLVLTACSGGGTADAPSQPEGYRWDQCGGPPSITDYGTGRGGCNDGSENEDGGTAGRQATAFHAPPARARCESLFDINASITANWGGGSFEHPELVADGRLDTHATLSDFPGWVAGLASIRARAQVGIVFPAGATAGAWLSARATGSGPVSPNVVLMAAINVYRSDILVATSDWQAVPTGGSVIYATLRSPEVFDAVEVLLGGVDPDSTSIADVALYELCGDGGAS